MDDVQVMDDFSFFSVSKQDAEKIVKAFNKIK
ncbi:MAG: DbpA RNA binding domain-containing protein [Patescibacteria group bacterium]